MLVKSIERQKAIKLRKSGKTYNEILLEVPVAKSTLSLWLREVGLSRVQKQVISQKRKAAQQRGGATRRRMRLEQTDKIFNSAIREVGKLSKRERLLIGAVLYWAEGAKEKAHYTSQGIDFANTDSYMARFFLNWLKEFLHVSLDDISFAIYVHKNHEYRLKDVVRHWSVRLNIPVSKITYIYFKKHNPKTLRKKIDSNTYFGTIRIRVRKSTNMQRKIQGMVYGITGQSCPVV